MLVWGLFTQIRKTLRYSQTTWWIRWSILIRNKKRVVIPLLQNESEKRQIREKKNLSNQWEHGAAVRTLSGQWEWQEISRTILEGLTTAIMSSLVGKYRFRSSVNYDIFTTPETKRVTRGSVPRAVTSVGSPVSNKHHLLQAVGGKTN